MKVVTVASVLFVNADNVANKLNHAEQNGPDRPH